MRFIYAITDIITFTPAFTIQEKDRKWKSEYITHYERVGDVFSIKIFNDFIKNNREVVIDNFTIQLPLLGNGDSRFIQEVGFIPVYNYGTKWVVILDLNHPLNASLKSIMRNRIIDSVI